MKTVLPIIELLLFGALLILFAGFVMSKFSYDDFLDRQIKNQMARHSGSKLRFPFRVEAEFQEEAPYKVEPKQ